MEARGAAEKDEKKKDSLGKHLEGVVKKFTKQSKDLKDKRTKMLAQHRKEAAEAAIIEANEVLNGGNPVDDV